MCLLLNHNYSLTHVSFRTVDYTASNWCQFVLLKKLLVLYQYQLSEDKQCPTAFNSKKKKKKESCLEVEKEEIRVANSQMFHLGASIQTKLCILIIFMTYAF